MKKYGFYELTKVKGKKEYIPSVKTIENSLQAAYEELQSYWDDCLDYPVWFNAKTEEAVAYERDDRMLYVPNEKYFEDEDGVLVPEVIGVYGRKPIYYIDEYPNPYTRYKLHKKGDHFTLEGIAE